MFCKAKDTAPPLRRISLVVELSNCDLRSLFHGSLMVHLWHLINFWSLSWVQLVKHFLHCVICVKSHTYRFLEDNSRIRSKSQPWIPLCWLGCLCRCSQKFSHSLCVYFYSSFLKINVNNQMKFICLLFSNWGRQTRSEVQPFPSCPQVANILEHYS